MRRAAVVGAAAAAIGLGVTAIAPARAQPPPRAVEATRAPSAIELDGRLDDAAWSAATPITELEQKIPDYGQPPRFPTEIRVLFDGDALYVGARMWDAPGATRSVLTRRDVTRDAERFIVSVDPYRSGRLAYSFAVTVAGVRADWVHTDDDERARDMSWDPVWSAATRRLPDGWSAEMRLPWTQLRYPERDGASWGINFNRYIPERNEDIFWIAVPRERTAWSSFMGDLRGLRGLPRRAGIELRPYVSGSVARLPAAGVAPGGDRTDLDGAVGVDLKVGVGAGLTVDVAVNPDFGQVEADPAIVNLSAFEVSLPERRPFFVAGAETFAAAPSTYFYTRRIGAEPDRILGAAKLSGRLGERTTLGALTALTDDTSVDGGLAGWTAARAERELSASRLGATVAAVARDATDLGAAPKPRASAVAGVDGVYRVDDGAWEAGGTLGASGLWGDAASVERVQRSSAHFFQRPDADHLALDPTRTSLGGWHGNLHAARRAGAVQGQLVANLESPGFDTNGTGLLQSADELSLLALGGWHDTTPSPRWHEWHVTLESAAAWTFGGELRDAFVELAANGVTPRYLGAELGGGVDLPASSDSLTRGGPLVATPASAYGFASVQSTVSSTNTWRARIDGRRAAAGQTGWTFTGAVSLRPGHGVRLELAPRLLVMRDRLEYVATRPDGPAETFDQRYVFATLDQRELVLVTRLELTLGPELAFDLYLEPFVSTGAYRDLAELTAAGTRDLRRYDAVERRGTTVVIDGGAVTLPEPDFTVRSLRSTAVLRWEPRPGSTLYVVWQQDRSRGEPQARALGSGVLDAFAAPGGHTVAVKLAWWFAR